MARPGTRRCWRWWSPARRSENPDLRIAGVVYLALTAAMCLVVVRGSPERWRPRLRLLGVRPVALAMAVLGSAAVVGIALALPAEPLGRLGIPVVEVHRD